MSDQIQQLQQLASTKLGMTGEATKPLVMLPGNGVQIRDVAGEVYKLTADQHALFYSSGLVMKLQQASGKAPPKLIPLEPAAARSEFEKYARFGRRSGKKTTEGVLSEGDAKAILLCDNARVLLPNVTALLNRPIPVLHNGGIEVLQVGYNARTGYLVAGGSIKEPDTLEEAVGFIKQILTDFSFQTDSDTSRAIACLLTPALNLGGFINGRIPVHIIEANESQTGKGTFLEFISLVYGEEPILVARKKGGVGSLDETFSEALLTGRPFIQFDNIRGELNSELLEAFLTNPATLLVRTPYSKSMPIDGSLRFVTMTSNNMTITEDLANRASFIRLEKEANREFTKIADKGFEEVIPLLQPHFMGAITKIIRHYHERGMPKTEEKRHDRREWAQKLDWIVQNIFELPPLMDGHEAAQKRVQNPALAFVRALAIQVEKVGRLGDELRAQELADICETGGIEIPGLNKKGAEGYTEKQEAQRIGQFMGQVFGVMNAIDVEAYRVIRRERLGITSVGNTYPGKRYEFRRITEQTAEAQELHFDI